SLLDVSQRHQCIVGSPNTTATGKPMAPLISRPAVTDPTGSVNADATSEHQCRCHVRA
ncbi:hypothetical protein K525DRAFT_155798, partial [Schizophyllum commune Loenen D]